MDLILILILILIFTVMVFILIRIVLLTETTEKYGASERCMVPNIQYNPKIREQNILDSVVNTIKTIPEDWKNNSAIKAKIDEFNGIVDSMEHLKLCTGNYEVFHIRPKEFGGDYITKEQADSYMKKHGYSYATLSQLKEEQEKGAQWCSTGFLADTPDLYFPMQIPCSGCGNQKGLIQYNGGIKEEKKGGINAYGIKPTADGDILPWYNPIGDCKEQKDTNPIIWSRYSLG